MTYMERSSQIKEFHARQTEARAQADECVSGGRKRSVSEVLLSMLNLGYEQPPDMLYAAARHGPAHGSTVAEIDDFEPEWDRIRAKYVPMLPVHQRIIARHRIAMLKSGAEFTRAARELAEGRTAGARGRFVRAVAAYPPSLFGRSGLGCARRLLLDSAG